MGGRRYGTGVIASPCTNVCSLDGSSGLCRGCLRTIDEIAGWGMAGDAEKRAVLDRVARRRAALDRDRAGGALD